MHIPFFKYQGTGNDFVIIDQRENKYISKSDQSLIERICNRRFGIGGDGLMLIQSSDHADFTMVYFNADGRTSSMCGNGGRCIVSLASRLGIFKDSCTFDAIDGLHQAKIVDPTRVALKMNDVSDIHRDAEAYVLDTGSPHYVRFETGVAELDMVKEGKAIRYNKTYKSEGINVNIAEWHGDSLQVRTYERGVEDETFSCGTGVVAAAISHVQQAQHKPDVVNIKTRGGSLKVTLEQSADGYQNIWLIGPATYVYEGIYKVDTGN